MSSSYRLGQPGPFLVDRVRELVQGVTEEVRRGLVRTPYGALRASQLTLLAQLPREGSRLTDIAERMQVSKQYVNQLVDGLVAMGILTRTADPSDGRARLVRPTRFALRGYVAGHRLLRSIHAEWRDELGERGYARLVEAIDRLLQRRAETSRLSELRRADRRRRRRRPPRAAGPGLGLAAATRRR